MRIAISQRVDKIEHYAERRDALDQRWAQRIESWGGVPVPVPNGLHDPRAWSVALGIQALLLTGGNDLSSEPAGRHHAPERDRTEFELLGLARELRWPVLGVCRGMQILNVFLGGKLEPVAGHVAVRHAVQTTKQTVRRLLGVTDTTEVNSFHGYGIAAEGLAPGLVPVLRDAQGHVEAAEHADLPWSAVMWHPERDPVPPREHDWLCRIFNLSP